nr:MAG TPA: hypothetical protein [Caudoviricetes sp.]
MRRKTEPCKSRFYDKTLYINDMRLYVYLENPICPTPILPPILS